VRGISLGPIHLTQPLSSANSHMAGEWRYNLYAHDDGPVGFARTRGPRHGNQDASVGARAKMWGPRCGGQDMAEARLYRKIDNPPQSKKTSLCLWGHYFGFGFVFFAADFLFLHPFFLDEKARISFGIKTILS